MKLNQLPILFIFLLIHLFLLIRLNFTAWPEMFSYPYLFLNGFSLYRDFVFPYPPGLVWLLSAVFSLFGFSPVTLKLLTWVLIGIVDLLFYFIIRRIVSNKTITYLFLGVFIIWQSFLDGNMLWFDFTTTLPLLGALLVIIKWLENRKLKYLFFIGLLLGCAVLIKQTTVIYLIGFGIFYLVNQKVKFTEIIYIFSGLGFAFVPLIIYLVSTNTLTEFWNWVIFYPLTKWSEFPGYVDFLISRRYILITLLILFPLIGLFKLWRKISKDKVIILLLIFLAIALITVYPRFSFFHLQPAITFLIIIFSKIYIELPSKLRVKYLSIIIVVSFLISVLLIPTNIGKNTRFYSLGDQALTESINSLKGDKKRIFLLGLDSSQYVFTKTLPPVHWSDNFGWYLEIPGVQEWVIDGLIKTPPDFVLWRVPSKGNWYNLGVYQPQKIVRFINQNYQKSGNINSAIEIWTKSK